MLKRKLTAVILAATLCSSNLSTALAWDKVEEPGITNENDVILDNDSTNNNFKMDTPSDLMINNRAISNITLINNNNSTSDNQLPPSIKVSGLESLNKNDITKSISVIPVIDIVDTDLDHFDIKIVKDEIEIFSSKNVKGQSFSKLIKGDGVYTITLTAVDKAGNKSSYIKKFTIDSTKPDVSVKGLESINKNNFTQLEKITPLASIADINFDSYSVIIKKNGKNIYFGDKLTSPVFTTDLIEGEGSYSIILVATDKAGNTKAFSKDFTIDSTIPKCDLFSLQNIKNNFYYREIPNTSIIIDEMNIDEYASYFMVNGTKYELNKNDVIKKERIDDNKLNYTLNNVITADGEYSVSYVVFDKAGNKIASESEIKFFIDQNNLDNIGFSNLTNGTHYKNNIKPQFTLEDYFLNKEDLNTLVKAKLNGNDYELKYVGKQGNILTFEGVNEISSYKDYDINTLEITYKDRGAKDNNEAFKESKIQFAIDTITPKELDFKLVDAKNPNNIAEIKDGKYYRQPYNPSITLKEKYINSAESYFAIVKDNGAIEKYYFNTEHIKVDESEKANDEYTYTLKDILKNEGAYKIYYHVEDIAKNILDTESQSKTIYLDTKTLDENQVTFSNLENDRHYNNNLVPTFTIKDHFIDKDDINKLITATIEVGDKVEPYTLVFDKKEGDTVYLKGSELSTDSLQNKPYKITLSYRDRAASGIYNNLEIDDALKSKSIEFVIDKQAPTIDVNFFDINGSKRDINNGEYYQNQIVPTFKISDNYIIYQHEILLNGAPYSGTIKRHEMGYYEFMGDTISKDGVYTIEVDAWDKAGNQAVTFTRTFTLDNTKPAIEISGVSQNEFNNKQATTPVIKVTDTNIDLSSSVEIRVRKNGNLISTNPQLRGDGTFDFTVYDEGNYTIDVTATDRAKNQITLGNYSFTIDRTKPIIKSPNITKEFINTKDFVPSLITETTEDTIFEVYIDNVLYSPNALPALTFNKEYEIKARAKDKAGNISDEYVTKFTIDTKSPDVIIEGLISNFFYNKTIKPDITYSDINLAGGEILLNGKPLGKGEEISEEGQYSLKISVSDKAGNITEKILDFVIDKTKPNVTIQGTINKVTGKNILSEIISPLIDMNDTEAIYTILLDGQEYYPGEEIKTEGKHTLLVKAVDKAGNVTETSVTFFIDLTPPSIHVQGVENGKTYNGAIKPVITTEDDAIKEMLLNGNPYNGEEISEFGSYELIVKSTDPAGNVNTQSTKFTIKDVGIMGLVSNPTSSGSMLGWLAIVAAGGFGTFLGLKKRNGKKINNDKTTLGK